MKVVVNGESRGIGRRPGGGARKLDTAGEVATALNGEFVSARFRGRRPWDGDRIKNSRAAAGGEVRGQPPSLRRRSAGNPVCPGPRVPLDCFARSQDAQHTFARRKETVNSGFTLYGRALRCG
jgi:hypothetical protein